MSKQHVVDGIYCIDPDCEYCNPFEKRSFGAQLSKIGDMVNRPSHYMMNLGSGVSVEALEVIEASLTREEYIGYLSGNILKYNMRKSNKNGEQDMLKSCFYAERLKVILETTC